MPILLLPRSHRPDPTCVVLILLLAALSPPPAVRAEPLPFTLAPSTAGTEVVFTVTSDSEVALHLVRTKGTGPPENIDLQLSQFTDESGRPLDVLLIVGKAPNAPKGLEHRDVKLTGPLLPLRLVIPELRTPGKYTGLLVLAAGNFDPAVWRIVLNPPGGPRPATLEVNPRVVTTSVICRLSCGQKEKPDFSVSLGDKTGTWPLDAITVRQEVATAGFDLRNLTFWFNGVKTDLPGTAASGVVDGPGAPAKTDSTAKVSPAPRRWTAARGERPLMGIAVHDLPAGEHTTTLRFQAANSGDDDAQKLALTVRVRHSWIWACVLLLLALLVSFVTTKAVVTIRQRLAFMSRVRDLERSKSWLNQMNRVLAVVWALDVLHQTKTLSRRYWLTGQDRIDAQLTQISSLLGVLEKVHVLQRDFAQDGAFPSIFIKTRAVAALNRIVRDLDGASLSDQQAGQIKTQLDRLADWLMADKQELCYWEDLKVAIDTLLRSVRVEEFLPAHQQVAETLKKSLEATLGNPNPPQGVQAKEEVEKRYARLKILWERRTLHEMKELIDVENRQPPDPLREIFQIADKVVWERLKAAPPKVSMAQLGGGAEVEAYELLRFTVEAGPDVAGTYLFKHMLKYEWTFTQVYPERKKLFLWESQQQPKGFPGQSCEPSIVAYPDGPGSLTASVIITNPAKGETLGRELKLNNIRVGKSSEFKWSKMFENLELLSWGIAGVIAMVSGLLLLYAKNATFGSLQDYLGLFMWGVGVDQGKNLAQLLMKS